MNYLMLLVVLITLHAVVAPPVNDKKKDEEKDDKNERFEEMGIEYNRYLVQVVEALESDPDFRKKLENATTEDIQSGNIAHELDFVAHNVRTKLDELKRVELDRLRKLARQQFEQENNIDTGHLKISEPEHVDHSNPHTFEIADLKKLIQKTAEDLAEADTKRREDFKTYEMKKEFEKQQKLNDLDEDKKKKYLEELEEQKNKHKKHEPLHHPGSKQQLEEVWEKQDHMENQEFDPKAFFFMHDLDGNGLWDEAEVKALFLKELDKLYQAGAPEDDMRERAEEMERMREHVFREADLNHDNLISFEEFLAQTRKPDFERDPGWESLDEQQIYTPEEYAEFERRRQEEITRLIQEGKLQPPPVYHPPPPGYHAPPHPSQGYQVPINNQAPPYQQQPQAYQQHEAYQQQQHFQQQQQNTFQQQQQYHQQNPQHFQQQQQPQQQQYQQPQQQNQQQQYQQPQQQNQQQQYQQPQQQNQQQQYQQPQQQNQQQQYQQPQQQNQQQQYQQPQQQNQQQQYQQPQQQNQQPQQNQQQQQQQQQYQKPQQQNQQQQPPMNQQPPSQAQQPIPKNLPQQPLSNSNSQQPLSNSIPQQPVNNIPSQNEPMMSNDIPKAQQANLGPPPPLPAIVKNAPGQPNSIPQGPK